jgi:hypothetical protein
LFCSFANSNYKKQTAMPRPNLLSQTLTQVQLAAIIAAFDAVEALMPWLLGLEQHQKDGFKLGPETLPFLVRANQLGHQDTINFVPPIVNLPENDKDVTFADQLGQIRSKSESLNRKIIDTFIEVGLEALEPALLIKAQIKLANRAGVPGAKAADDELSALFKHAKATPPTP